MQMTERNPVIIGVVVVAVIVAVTAAGLTITRDDLVDGYELTAQFADANGLRVGDQVLIAGVRAGRVLDLEIVDDHVEARLQVEEAELPRDTRARVILRTLVGTRAVALESPSGDFSELLGEGDVIPLERTTTTIDVPEFGDVSEELLTEIDSEAFNEFLRSVTALTEGQREEVASLVDGGTRLTRVVNEQETQIRELLRQLRGVGSTLNSRDAELIAIIDDFDVALGRLAERRDDIRRLFRETTAASNTAADLVVDTRTELDSILTELHRDIELINANQVNLAEALAYSGDSILGFSSIALAAGGVEVPWGDVFVTSMGPAGVDVLAGCGGLIDQQLDTILGPDPRPCSERENITFPDDVNPPEDRQGPELPLPDAPLPDLPLPLSSTSEARHPVDTVARRLFPPVELSGEVGR